MRCSGSTCSGLGLGVGLGFGLELGVGFGLELGVGFGLELGVGFGFGCSGSTTSMREIVTHLP